SGGKAERAPGHAAATGDPEYSREGKTMIIPSNALLALLSPPQESQGTREEGGFGALLAEIEQPTISLPDQEEAERRALESVLQVLMNIFQSCTPANLSPAASAPGTEESGLVSMRLVGGLRLGFFPL